MHTVQGVGDVLQERPVEDAPLSVKVVLVAIFDASEIVSDAGAMAEFVESQDAVLASVHEYGVISISLQVLAEGVEVVVGVGRPREVVLHQRGDAGHDSGQCFKTSATVRHTKESEALTEERVEEGCDFEPSVVAIVPKHFLPNVFHDDDDHIARNAV